MWEAFRDSAIPTPDGPLPVEKGDVVAVIIVPSWAEMFGRLLQIVKSETRGEGE